MTSTPTGGTQAIARAAALLREIASSNTGVSLADLAMRVQLERPTAYRILQRLVVEGLAEQNPTRRTYTLGPLVYELGLATSPPKHFQTLARDAIATLARESGDTVFAIAASGRDSLCIDREEGHYPVKALLMDIGRRRPLGAGAGSLCLLSALAEDKALEMLQLNQVRLQNIGESNIHVLHDVVQQARQDGYVLRTPTDAPEILSLAVPVVNRYGSPVFALSISALHFRIKPRLDMLLQNLKQAQQQLQTSLSAPTPVPHQAFKP